MVLANPRTSWTQESAPLRLEAGNLWFQLFLDFRHRVAGKKLGVFSAAFCSSSKNSITELTNIDADPDPAFHFDTDSDPDPTTHFSSDLDPLMLHDPLRLPPFHFDADPDPGPAFHFDADADPVPQPLTDLNHFVNYYYNSSLPLNLQPQLYCTICNHNYTVTVRFVTSERQGAYCEHIFGEMQKIS